MLLPQKQSDFKPSQALIQAGENVVYALAQLQSVQPIVTAYQSKVLAENEFYTGQKWVDRGETYRRILKEADTHMLTDEDAAIYYPLLDTEVKKAGFDLPEGYCPALVAESAVREAKNGLLDELAPVFGFTRDDIFSTSNAVANYNEAVSIGLGLLRPFLVAPHILLARRMQKNAPPALLKIA